MSTFHCDLALLTSKRLYLLVLGELHFIRDFGNDEVLRAHLPDGVGQGVQAPGVLGQYVQQHGCPLGLRCPAADFLCVVPRQDSARAQEVEVALGPDLVAEVVPQPGQHLEIHGSRAGEERGEPRALLEGTTNSFCSEMTCIHWAY